MKEKTACITGHRRIPAGQTEAITKRLMDTLINCIKDGYCYFGVGGAWGFDTIVANLLLHLKATYPYIKLIIVLPCLNQTKFWDEADIIEYERIKNQADKVVYTSYSYFKGCMQKKKSAFSR